MSFDLDLINGDILLGADGDVQTISGIEKLKQDIIKILITEIGSNRYQPWYGSRLDERLIGTAQDTNMIVDEVYYAIGEALDRLKKLQQAQQSMQGVTPDELIQSVQDIMVKKSPIDPRNLFIIVKILSKSLKSVEETFTL